MGQLAVVFSAKTVGKQIGYTLRPFVFRALHQLKILHGYKKVTSAAEKMLLKVPGSRTVMAHLPGLGQVTDSLFGEDVDAKHEQEGLHFVQSEYELQMSQLSYTGTFDDFNDRVVQFGYLVLFAPAFPLAPLLALINNVVEIRTSAYRMVKGFQRPVWRAREGIGTWMNVLDLIGFLGVITNAAMISFVGRQRSRILYVPEEASSFLLDRIQISALWFNFLVVEHSVLCLRVVVLALIPDVPEWIRTAKDTLGFRNATYFKTQEQKDLDRRYAEKYAKKLAQSKSAITAKLGATMQHATRDALEEEFNKIDLDASGALDRNEIHELFSELKVILSDVELDFTMAAIDDDQSGEVKFDELMLWLISLGCISKEQLMATPTTSRDSAQGFGDDCGDRQET